MSASDTSSRFVLIPVHGLDQLRHAKVSESDHELVWPYQWHAASTREPPYAAAYRGGKTILMHRLITGAPADMVVDHKNHDTLDNRRENLRLTHQRQNTWNMVRHRDSASEFKGVFQHGTRFVAKIQNQHIGTFPTARHAALAYNDAARERFGEHASLNELTSEEELQLRESLDEGRRAKTSKYKGVSYIPGSKRPWRAVKRLDGKDFKLGFFERELDAALSIDDFCLQRGLDRKHMNFPEQPVYYVRERRRGLGATGRVLPHRVRPLKK